MNMRLACSAGLAALAMASLAGCSTRDGGANDTVEQASASLAGTFTLKNYVTGLCLGFRSDGYAIAKTCNGGADQNWTTGPTKGDGSFDMISSLTPVPYRCLDKDGAFECTGLPGNDYCYYQGDGPCSASSGWRLYFTAFLGNLYCYRFEDDLVRGLILGTENASHSNGARAVIVPNTGNMDQVWCVPQSAGYY